MHFAAGEGHEAICRFLVQACQADVNAHERMWQRTPLHLAAEAGHEGVCRFLVQACQADVNARDDEQRTPLHYAAEWGYKAVCQVLVAQDAAVDARNDRQRTPLHVAAEKGHEGVCWFLVQACQADVNVRDRYQVTPLHWAAEAGQEAVCRVLVQEYQADVNARDIWQRTPLHFAAGKGQEAVCRVLVQAYQADVNARDSGQRTPLLGATEKGHTDLAGQFQRWAELRTKAADTMAQYAGSPVSSVQLQDRFTGLHPSMSLSAIREWCDYRTVAPGFISNMRPVIKGKTINVDYSTRTILSFLEPSLAKKKPIMQINLQAWHAVLKDHSVLEQLWAWLMPNDSSGDKCFMAAEVLRLSKTSLAICAAPHIVKMAVHYGVEEISVSGPSSPNNPA